MPALIGTHAAQTERAMRGYQWLWPGAPGPAVPITFRERGFHHPDSSMGFRVLGQGGAQVRIGIKGRQRIPFDGVIQFCALMADAAGSCLIDIRKTSVAGYAAGAVGDSICPLAQFKPRLANERSSFDWTLFGWSTRLLRDDVLIYDVLELSGGITALTMSLSVSRNSLP